MQRSRPEGVPLNSQSQMMGFREELDYRTNRENASHRYLSLDPDSSVSEIHEGFHSSADSLRLRSTPMVIPGASHKLVSCSHIDAMSFLTYPSWSLRRTSPWSGCTAQSRRHRSPAPPGSKQAFFFEDYRRENCSHCLFRAQCL